MGSADLIVDGPMSLQISGALVELFSVPEADAVHDEVTVQMVCVDVSSDQHLEIGELPLGQFQSDGVGLLGASGHPSLRRTGRSGSTAARPFFETAPW